MIGVPDDVPMTVTGKVRKVEMREESVRRFCASARAGRVRLSGPPESPDPVARPFIVLVPF